MTFVCNSQIIIWHFFRSWNLIILGLQHIYIGYLVCPSQIVTNLVNAIPATILPKYLKLCRCFQFFSSESVHVICILPIFHYNENNNVYPNDGCTIVYCIKYEIYSLLEKITNTSL